MTGMRWTITGVRARSVTEKILLQELKYTGCRRNQTRECVIDTESALIYLSSVRPLYLSFVEM